MVTGFNHSGFVVQDLDVMVAFYRDTLGLTVVREADSIAPEGGDHTGFPAPDGGSSSSASRRESTCSSWSTTGIRRVRRDICAEISSAPATSASTWTTFRDSTTTFAPRESSS